MVPEEKIIAHIRADGDADRRVELVQSTEFATKMKEVGAACELIVVPGGKHGMGDARKPEMLERMIGFFDGHLKPGG